MKKMLCYCRESTMHPSPGALLGWSLGSYLGYWSGLGLSVVRLTVRWMLEGGANVTSSSIIPLIVTVISTKYVWLST